VPEGTLTGLMREVFAGNETHRSTWDGALEEGARIGRFELVREIGRGGFGSVWEARDTELKRKVAFKAIHSTGSSAADERALAEAETAAHLSHPSIVTLFDAGRSVHGPYLVMELLQGEPLSRRLERGALAPREALRIAGEIARGLSHAHARGVVHPATSSSARGEA
jgi:serine/threonine protein kinase